MGEHRAGGIIRRGISGAGAGMAGTAAMSLALGVADLRGIMDHQPPRIIVEDLLPSLSRGETNVLTLVSHVGYGAGAGAAYAVLVAPAHRNAWTGALYGVGVWAVGYEGWLPLLGILPPAHRDKPGRAWTMFAAHVVYEAVLGRAAARHRKRRSR
ncbi:DUF1440 domain-containing protein [Arthrobacter rhombi]|uniref:DUF1440 domain-containing protein n=1 Tax=Arthrobacter rhombi TaxID=71253 RepID=UPI0031D71190